jgi:hypothetical protein
MSGSDNENYDNVPWYAAVILIPLYAVQLVLLGIINGCLAILLGLLKK